MKNKKRVTFSKPLHYKHNTQAKKKNMVGSNPEVEKRKAIKQAFVVNYTSNSTSAPENFFVYTISSSNESQTNSEQE